MVVSASCLPARLYPSMPGGDPDHPDIDWSAVEKEAGELLSQVVQIDTSNPPGNETAAAQFWQNILIQEGIEAQVYESEPGRGIIYGRLKGSGKKKALILLHHLDVGPR